MNENHTLQYYHFNALLVVNPMGMIRVLYTPFRVICTARIGVLAENVWVYVEEVHSNNKDELQYIIFGAFYSYKYFAIPIQF